MGEQEFGTIWRTLEHVNAGKCKPQAANRRDLDDSLETVHITVQGQWEWSPDRIPRSSI